MEIAWTWDVVAELLVRRLQVIHQPLELSEYNTVLTAAAAAAIDWGNPNTG